jgi:hypothetical protein
MYVTGSGCLVNQNAAFPTFGAGANKVLKSGKKSKNRKRFFDFLPL